MSWSDNSTWGYTNWWENEESNGVDYYIRLAGDDGTWISEPIHYKMFICQLASQSLRGNEKVNLIYKKNQSNFRSFHLWYEYKAASQQVLDSSEDKRMTGFKLTWRIENSTWMANSSEVVKNTKNNNEKSNEASHTWLVKLVKMAQYLRVNENLTEEQIMDKVVRGKVQNISILSEGICANDQIKSGHLDETFPNLVSLGKMESQAEPATNEDLRTGFELYHALVSCPVIDIKLYSFVNQLLSSESPRTLIQSYANLFRSGVLKGTTSITSATEFYVDLAVTLNLQYGNILLATSTKSQLQAVRDMDGPFFINNSDLVKTCVVESQCDGLQDIIGDLGREL